MKKFWLVLLSLGLIMAFSVSAFAVDVKVSAEYYAGGLYLNKTSVADGYRNFFNQPSDDPNPSTAFYFQRLRVGTDFIVSPCLKLVTRFDAMERIWGGQRSDSEDSDPNSAGTRAENENIAFDVTYIDYASPIGTFKVGYMPDYVWGTVFADKANGPTAGQIKFSKPIGPFTVVLGYAKEADDSYSAVNYSQDDTDQDYDSYRLGGIYNFKGNKVSGEAGVLLIYERDATFKADENFVAYYAFLGPQYRSFLKNSYKINPYAKVKIGPVDLQAELVYNFGDAYKWEDNEAYAGWPAFWKPVNASIDALSVFIDATANFGMFYVGGSFAYLSGDDPGTMDKVEGGINNAGLDWNPCLILFNNDVVADWIGGVSGQGGPLGGNRTQVGGPMSNAWFGQLRGGVRPTPQLDIMMSLSYAKADKNMHNKTYFNQNEFWYPWANYPGTSYGFEVDVVGTYKITNNLSYMLGAGYLFTGDYYKGYDQAGREYKVVDDFMFINKLILSF
jgi:hypothetical protein